MSDLVEVAPGGVQVRIKGLRKLQRDLNQAGADIQDQKALMHEIGMLVVRAAQPPSLTGRLESTIRAGKGKTKAVVRAGGARAPYATVIHYGWPAREIAPQPFLLAALQSERTQIVTTFENGLDDLLRKNDLI